MRASTSGQADVKNLEKSVVEWLRTELDDPEISGSDNFLDVGGHSLIFARLNKFLADSFGIVLEQKATYSDPLSAAMAAARPISSNRQAAR